MQNCIEPLIARLGDQQDFQKYTGRYSQVKRLSLVIIWKFEVLDLCYGRLNRRCR